MFHFMSNYNSQGVLIQQIILFVFFWLLQTYLESAKTQLLRHYRGMNPSKITSTVGLNIGRVVVGGIALNFWDLGGQLELQSLWDKVKGYSQL